MKGVKGKQLTLLAILFVCLIVATVLLVWFIKEFEHRIPEKKPDSISIYTYSLSGFEDETQEHFSTVVNKVMYFDEAKFVTSENKSSLIVFIHPYSVGGFDPSSAEWIAIFSSIPTMTNETKIAIFRLDYQTLEMKKAYKFSYPLGEQLTLENVVTIMEEEMIRDPYGSGSVNSKEITVLEGNYVYSYPALDFGGTIIVNKYTGTAIFYATTVWDGTGNLLIPEE